jgi:hypothetical protein
MIRRGRGCWGGREGDVDMWGGRAAGWGGMCSRRNRCFKGDRGEGLEGLCRMWRDRWGGGRLGRGMRGVWMRRWIDLLDRKRIRDFDWVKVMYLRSMSDLPRRDMIVRHIKIMSDRLVKGIVNHRLTDNITINTGIIMDMEDLHLRVTINHVRMDILLRLKDMVNHSTDNLGINNHLVDNSSTDNNHPHMNSSIMDNLRIVEVLMTNVGIRI